jgi:hypothetical protein
VLGRIGPGGQARAVNDDPEIPPLVRLFILEHLNSIEQLEVLLLLHRTAPVPWTAPAISAELRSSPSSVAQRLTSLVARRLVEKLDGDAYRFAPEHKEVREAVQAVAETYRVRPYTIMELISGNRSPLLRQRAQALRTRKGGKDG